MIKRIFLFSVLLFAFGINAQPKYFAGAGMIYGSPLGTFSDRVKGNFGATFFWGENINNDLSWRLKGEYFKTSKPNYEKLFVRVDADINNQTKQLTFPLNNIEMDFTLTGIAAEGDYKFLTTEFFSAELVFGFGFYYWEHTRGSYSDSLFVDTTGLGNFMLVKKLNVPKLFQKDWSGGLTLGLNFNFHIVDPFSIELAANYKLIIAELWPALSLDIENVSGIQMFDMRAGVKIDF